MEINTKQAYEACKQVLHAGLVPYLISSPGIGKSSLAAQLAKEFNLKLVDIRLAGYDPTFIDGFPMVDLKTNRTTFVPMSTFPIETDELPKGKKGWLILLDELPASAPSVQAASYRLILDKEVGQCKLHPKVYMMAAGNKASDGAIASNIGTALQSRLITLNLRCDAKVWTAWAMDNKLDDRVISFVEYRPDSIERFDPDHTGDTFSCARTMHFLSDILIKNKIKVLTNEDHLHLLSGTVGDGVAVDFIAYCSSKLPNIKDILDNPATVEISDEPSILYLLTGFLSTVIDVTNGPALMTYIERMPIEFQIICLRKCSIYNKEFKDSKLREDWLVKNSERLSKNM